MLRDEAALLQSHCYKNLHESRPKYVKWNVLSLRLNVETVLHEVRSVGSLLQILGPANENARRPNEEAVVVVVVVVVVVEK
jgi:hypothetical protein